MLVGFRNRQSRQLFQSFCSFIVILKIKQEGFYKDGKVHGKWISYSESGNKISLGEFNKGEKTGKWFFWSQNSLSEVDYNNSRVADVKKWSQEALAQRN